MLSNSPAIANVASIDLELHQKCLIRSVDWLAQFDCIKVVIFGRLLPREWCIHLGTIATIPATLPWDQTLIVHTIYCATVHNEDTAD